uniref:Uncharacterized protein n=1 Tax=Plectus sambesii TaxID=2011161 RepID=A0A914UMS9_9BILA
MENRVEQSTDHKMVLYSGHDVNIMSFAKSLELLEIQNTLAIFGAYIAIELHRRMGQYYIEIWYHPLLNQTRIPIAIEKCGTPCSFDVFKRLVPLVSDAEFEMACHGSRSMMPLPNAIENNQPQETWIVILGALCAVLSILLLCTCYCFCQARMRLAKMTDSERRRLLDGNRPARYIIS